MQHNTLIVRDALIGKLAPLTVFKRLTAPIDVEKTPAVVVTLGDEEQVEAVGYVDVSLFINLELKVTTPGEDLDKGIVDFRQEVEKLLKPDELLGLSHVTNVQLTTVSEPETATESDFFVASSTMQYLIKYRQLTN